MSVVTLEQQTLVVMTELADEEIGGLVGGYGSPVFKPKTETKTEAKGKNVIVTNQVANVFANGRGDAVSSQNSYSEINNSKNKVRIFGYH
ncbi:MAG: hypothetical protein RMY34_34360 [Aulosira sp. DedQUE10]|nr:hypothetical protein [Aulosira sp. DedQUE10]MDZ7962893.1 hypothetical protein [Aulosira sp. DedQUE10]MDZ7962894.1 hypothetical protein [Aulosira sp. DedQUE10]